MKIRLDNIERRVSKGFSEYEEDLQDIRFLIDQLRMPAELEEEKKKKKGKLGF